MLTRRQVLARGTQAATAALVWPGCAISPGSAEGEGVWLNDIHSQLNRTRVARVQRPTTADQLVDTVRGAARSGARISMSGGRHAMGGQQFASDAWHLDLSGLNAVHAFDRQRGLVEVGSGIQWPALIDYLLEAQVGDPQPWGITQKQTGADRLSLGGALAANAHGRVLTRPPIVSDVESFELVTPRGELIRCSRSENTEIFRYAIGGYGLFGAFASVTLRLSPRRRIERVVEILDVDQVSRRMDERIAAGFLFGDFQYETALDRESGMRRGVFSCYRPVDDDREVDRSQDTLVEDDWKRLLLLAHHDQGRAFDEYAAYYLGTSGQIYWSDTHQLSTYIDDYHHHLAGRLGELAGGTEMISELYVPRESLATFMEAARRDLKQSGARLIYGTVRLIERDAETALPWARDPWACVIFNLHTQHDPASLRRTARDFRGLIERAARLGGSYFLTYHRWATREQALRCHPNLPSFLAAKQRWDPSELFTSEWHRHQRKLLA